MAIASLILGNLLNPQPKKKLDIITFYTNSSVQLLANQLPPGQSLGKSEWDSKNPNFHTNWAKNSSPAVLKQVLIEKFKRMAQIKESEGKEALAWWYALVCTNWANYNIDFGSDDANNPDWSLHEKWGADQPLSVVQEQLEMRVNKIFKSFKKPKQPTIPNLTIHPKNVMINPAHEEGTIFVWYELNAKGDLEIGTIEMGILLRCSQNEIWLKRWKLDSWLMDILRDYGLIQQSFTFTLSDWEEISSGEKCVLSVQADLQNRLHESNEDDNVVDKEFD